MKASTLLRRLERIRTRFDPEAAEIKTELLTTLNRRRLEHAAEVQRLHDTVCFLRAYPDNRDVLTATETLLGRFEQRGDLKRFRGELADTGIAGTSIYFRFYYITAVWLADRLPQQLRIDWEEFENDDDLVDILHLLLPYAESLSTDNARMDAREWIEALRGPDETDATFLVRRFAAMSMDVHGREGTFEGIDVPFRIEPGPRSPSRTDARYRPSPVAFQSEPLSRTRPRLTEEVHRAPEATRSLSPREGQELIDLTREAMITRSRDLYVFLHADRRDVRLIECGNGLQFACIGATPERRLVLESVYGFLTLKNGVPIGYVLSSSLFGSSEIAFNVFESFRGAEAGVVFGRVLAMVRHLFGSDTYSIDPYQLGHNNPEGLLSGAWWFYYKLGFRPHDADVRRLLKQELACMKRDPGHRSSVETLNRLSAGYMFLHLEESRDDVLGRFPLGDVGLAVSAYLARRFGADRETAIRTCAAEAADRLGLRSTTGFSKEERLLWERWSPLVMALPGVARWNAADRRALVQVIRAKGGRRESDYVTLFNRHRRLRTALRRLAESGRK